MSNRSPQGEPTDDVLRVALDRLPDLAFFTLTRDGFIASWNHGAHRLFGHGEAEAFGRHVSVLFPSADDAGGVEFNDLCPAEQHDSSSCTRWFKRKDGDLKFVRMTCMALATESEVTGYAIIAHELPSPAAGASETKTPGVEDSIRELSESRALLAAEIADRTQADEARVRLLRRLMMAEEEERRRLARELHDNLGQRLTALRLMLETLEPGARGAAGRPSSSIENALQLLAQIDHDVDFIAWEMRPAALDDLGLVRALRPYIQEWSRHTGVRATFDARLADAERFAPELEGSVYRIVQEALNNVAKHASAQSVHITLNQQDQHILLTVEDDGVGFLPQRGAATMLGVAGMRERALALGGALEIESGAHGGTTVIVRVPATLTPNRPSVLDAAGDPGGLSVPEPHAAKALDEAAQSDSALKAIRLRLQQLQRAIAARDEFIATVAHELRNPIAPLSFQVRLALNKMDHMMASGLPVQADWVKSQFHGVEQRLHRLLETLDRLLDVSRLSTGRIDLQPEPMNLGAAVREVLGSLDAELAVARCTVNLSEHGDTTGTWDRLRVEQICRNLFSNAIRFGAGRPIEITVTGNHECATLQVRDHGVGIPPHQQQRIFERFERGVDQRSGGFGVGLWLVRNICLAMGGTVSVESEPAEGACFNVVLPRRSARPLPDSEGVH